MRHNPQLQSARTKVARSANARQDGGLLMRGTRTHADARHPSAKKLRQRWHVQVNRGYND
jgi:hypothetical protein